MDIGSCLSATICGAILDTTAFFSFVKKKQRENIHFTPAVENMSSLVDDSFGCQLDNVGTVHHGTSGSSARLVDDEHVDESRISHRIAVNHLDRTGSSSDHSLIDYQLWQKKPLRPGKSFRKKENLFPLRL